MNLAVSVVIPCADMAHFLPDAVGSILRQAMPVTEILIVFPPDDGDTAAMAKDLADRGAPVVPMPVGSRDRGPLPPMNAGLGQARGEVIAFLDGDDLWPANKLSLQMSRLTSEPRVDVVGGLTVRFDRLDRQALMPAAESRTWVEPLPNTGALICRREVFEQTGPFDESLLYAGDVDFLMRLRDHGIAYTVLDEPTLYYRNHDNSMMAATNPRKVSDFRVAAMKSVRRRRSMGLPPDATQILTGHVESWPR